MVISQFPARFGKYILLDRLNAGGMAEVFRAKVTGAEKFERLVAIKCMLPQLMSDENFISMFIDEAKLAAQLNHANIVQIYELGRLGERLYIAMELVHGRDLRHIIRTARANMTPVPVGFAAYVVSKASGGLDFAHRKAGVDGQPLNLVHRDVSPQNILVSYDGEVKVVDFGIAKAEARNTETQAGVLKGKFAYMAPEQVTGSRIDCRADIFAMGSVLYEVITGQRLFTGDNDLSVLEKVRAAKLPDLRAILPAGGEDFEHVLLHALAKKPDDRYTHASEMAEDLEHLLIEDRSIFGAKRAAQFMQTLYAAEVTQLQENIRHYATVTAESCEVSIGDEESVPDADRIVFDAAADAPGATDRIGKTVQTEPTRQVEPPSVVRRRPRAPPPDFDGPVTGAQTRPMAMRRGLGRRSPPASPAVERRPITTRTSRVLRNLRVGLILSAFVTSVLVILVYLKIPITGRPNPMDELRDVLHGVPERLATQIFPLIPPAPPASPAAVEDPASRDDDSEGASGHGRYGWVTLRTGAADRGRVYIDGNFAGALPLLPKRLKVGIHELKITDDGGTTRHQSFMVKPNNTKKFPKQVLAPGTATP